MRGIKTASESAPYWERRAQERPRYLRGLARHSHARPAMRKIIAEEIRRGARQVLEVGVGGAWERRYVRLPRRSAIYTGIDISPTFIARAQERYPHDTWLVRDIMRDEPIPADIVFSTHVLEHCPPLEQSLGWLLRSAQQTLLNVFFQPPGETQVIGRSRNRQIFSTIYCRRDVVDICIAHGFSVEFLDFDNGDFKRTPRGCVARETLLVARKQNQ